MSSATANFRQPNLELFPCGSCILKSVKSICSPRIPTSKLSFSGGLSPKKAGSGRNRAMGPNSIELNRMLPLRNVNSDEGVGALRQEDYIDGSSDLSPLIVDNGVESTLNRLSKWVVSLVFAVVILWRHDAEAIWAAMGSVVNTLVSVTLKRILNQDRPAHSLRSEPGMPSSHAQSIFYISVFIIVSVVEWLGINVITLIISGLALAFGSYLSWLRVSQRLHTPSQVVVGATLGSLFSIFWYWSWNAGVHEAFISNLWVRIVVFLGAAVFCLGFLLYVIRYWIRDER